MVQRESIDLSTLGLPKNRPVLARRPKGFCVALSIYKKAPYPGESFDINPLIGTLARGSFAHSLTRPCVHSDFGRACTCFSAKRSVAHSPSETSCYYPAPCSGPLCTCRRMLSFGAALVKRGGGR